jgi:hypothetical protein
MFHLVVGPFLFAAGLALIYVAIHGMPRMPSLRSLLSPQILGLGSHTGSRTREQAPPNGFTSGDVLVGEMLTEMMTLREQLAELQEQVASSRGRGRRTQKLAS